MRAYISTEGWKYVGRFEDGHDLYPNIVKENRWLDLCPFCYEEHTVGIGVERDTED